MEQLRWSCFLWAWGQRKHLPFKQQRGCHLWFSVSSYNPAISPPQQWDCRTPSAEQSASAQHNRVASPSTHPTDLSTPGRNKSHSFSSEDASGTLSIRSSSFIHILCQSSQESWHFLRCKLQVGFWPRTEYPIIVWKWGKINWMQSGTGRPSSRGFSDNILQCG